MDKRLKFNEPWILQRADPYVYEKRMAGIILRHRFRHMTALYCAGQKIGRSSTGRGSGHLEKA